MTGFTINKGFVLAMALIVVGVIGLVDSASAEYSYKHNPRDNYKFNNHHKGHHYNRGVKHRYYKKRHRNHYSSRHKSYNKGYVRNHSYRHHKRRYAGRHQYYNGYSSNHYSNNRNYYSPKASPHCYTYKVTSHGGQGGFRFQHDKKAFKRINNGSYSNKICGYDNVEFELSKVEPSVSITIEINDTYFHYPSHSGHDRFINNWHRKYFSVNFGHY